MVFNQTVLGKVSSFMIYFIIVELENINKLYFIFKRYSKLAMQPLRIMRQWKSQSKNMKMRSEAA